MFDSTDSLHLRMEKSIPHVYPSMSHEFWPVGQAIPVHFFRVRDLVDTVIDTFRNQSSAPLTPI